MHRTIGFFKFKFTQMSFLTSGVAVAVKVIIGILGTTFRMKPSWRYELRKS